LRGAGWTRSRSLRPNRMPAELVAQRGVDLRRKRLVLTRREPREERSRDHGNGNVFGNRLGDRPAALAGVLDVAADAREVGAAVLEGSVQELEEPRADNRPVTPDAGDLVQVELELGAAHDLEPLRVRLHEAVLDPVVDHLHEVASTGRTDVRVPVLGCERPEERLEPSDRLGVASRHQAVADLEAPDASGDADVDEVDTAR